MLKNKTILLDNGVSTFTLFSVRVYSNQGLQELFQFIFLA